MSTMRDDNGNYLEIEGIKVHPLANMVPMATGIEQAALQQSIERNGQREEIVLYRKQIVDGRCRAIACRMIGIKVESRSLPHKMPLEEVRQLVLDMNTRRNLTPSQKAIIAAREVIANPGTDVVSICKVWGVSKQNYYAAKHLEAARPILAQLLFEGKKVAVDDGKMTLSVQTVSVYVKRQDEQHRHEALDALESYDWDERSQLKNQAQEDAYNEAMKSCGGYNVEQFHPGDVSHVLRQLIERLYP